MRRSVFSICSMVIILAWSCGQQSDIMDSHDAKNTILQQEDGSLSLYLVNAACYTDSDNPSSNTAEWHVVVDKPGRFTVWLSSATKDTLDLNYSNSVRISLLDDYLDVHPGCDKIVKNSREVPHPYFRADSFMGSFYISKPGEYNIQVISEKVNESNWTQKNTAYIDDTKILSVLLTPVTL